MWGEAQRNKLLVIVKTKKVCVKLEDPVVDLLLN